MADQRNIQRAESELEYTGDPLLVDENDDEGDNGEDDERESECCNQAEDHDGQDDEKKTDGKKGKATKSDKDLKSKKLAKASKIHYNVAINFGLKASNTKDLLEEKNAPSAGTSGAKMQKIADKTGDNEPSSSDAKKIQSLEREKKILEKRADYFFHELEDKKSVISKLEGQLSTLQTDNDRLKGELRDMQRLQQSVNSSMETHNDKHGNEVKRLQSKLTTATELLERMKLTTLSQVEESRKLSEELENGAKEKEDLINQMEQKEASHRSEMDKLKESLQQKKCQNTELTDRVNEITLLLQAQVEETSLLRAELKDILHTAEDEVNPRPHKNGFAFRR